MMTVMQNRPAREIAHSIHPQRRLVAQQPSDGLHARPFTLHNDFAISEPYARFVDSF